MRQIKLFYFWLKLIWKVRKLKDWALLSDMLFIQDDTLILAISIYKLEGSTIEEKRADLVALIRSHYMLKQTVEYWPVPLNYEVGKILELNKTIRKHQPYVDARNDYNDLM